MALTLEELCRNSENDYGMMLIAGKKYAIMLMLSLNNVDY